MQKGVRPYYRASFDFHSLIHPRTFPIIPLDENLHSPERRLIELRIEHGDLDAMIDRAAADAPADELRMRRLKKRRLALRDQIARVELGLEPDEPA